jgi:hypothetical protein
MRRLRSRPVVVAIVLGAVAVPVAGCGGSSQPAIPVSSRLEHVNGSSVGQIVLSQLGAQRIGLRTATTQAVPAPAEVTTTTVLHGIKHTATATPAPTAPTAPTATAIIPYSAVVYDPNGKTYAFTNTGPLTYVEVPITVEHISGNSTYLTKGPKPGTQVVSVGAEELYGVQTGVLAQT